MRMDPYSEIAAFYDCEHAGFSEDLDFYAEILTHGPVLELGCGTGRITRMLVEAGLETWAIDSSAPMLDRARQALGEHTLAHLVQADLLALKLDRMFPVALLSLNTLWHFPDPDQQLSVLTVIRRHLSTGATLIIDSSNPLTLSDRGADGQLRERFHGICNGRPLTISSAAWDDEAEQRLTLSLHYDSSDGGLLRRISTTLQLRYLYRHEIELMLRLTGFQASDILGDYGGDPYHRDSPNLIVLAEAV